MIELYLTHSILRSLAEETEGTWWEGFLKLGASPCFEKTKSNEELSKHMEAYSYQYETIGS